MQYQKIQKSLIVRLGRGEKLIERINELAEKEHLKGAWLQGLGGAESVELGYYDLETQQYQWQSFDELMEITSLQGNLAWADGQPKWHIHATLSGRDYQAIGGHVRELIAGATCELKLDVFDEPLLRAHDDTVGLDLLQLT